MRPIPLACGAAILWLATASAAPASGRPDAPAALAGAWPIRGYYDFLHHAGIGDFDGALQAFADDATVVAGDRCPALRPCVGKEAIAAHYLAALRQGSLPLPLVDQRFDGRWLHTRGDTAPAGAQGGPGGRRLASHRIELRGGLIQRLELRWLDGDAAAHDGPMEARARESGS